MSPFWAGLFENLRGRGRNAGLFLVVLPTLLVTTLVAVQIPDEIYHDYVIPVLPWVGALLCLFMARAILRARARRRERLRRPPLSPDELNKARTKLVKRSRGIFSPPAP